MAKPLHSVTWYAAGIAVDGTDHFLLLQNREPAAGALPTGSCLIVGYAMRSEFTFANSYVVVGKTQPYGDWIGPKLVGKGSTGPVFFPQGGFPWVNPIQGVQPGDANDQLHAHYLSTSVDANNGVEITIFYTLDSDPDLTNL